MKIWINNGLQLRRQMLSNLAAEKNIEACAIEKDWWVTTVLKALFMSSCQDYLSFKGGTSLSKGWKLIERFSEDIDISLHHSFFGIESTTKNQREKLRKQSRKYITEQLSKELYTIMMQLGAKDFAIEPENMTIGSESRQIASDKDPVVLNIGFKSIMPSMSGYMLPYVKLEISCLSMDEPTEKIPLSSMIRDFYPTYDTDTCLIARTVTPTRTFLEKAFLLCEEFQKDNPRTLRITRHFYDLFKLSATHFAEDALNDANLYIRIIEHRKQYYNVHYVDYNRLLPEFISFIPPDSLIDGYRADYQKMVKEYIYDSQAPDFDQLRLFLKHLQNRFRVIK